MTALALLARPFTAVSLPAYPSVTGIQQQISPESLALFLLAAVWGGVLLVCFAGWGRFAARLLRLEGLPASIACSLGIAVIVFFGGLLNLSHAVYKFVVFLLIAIGIALCFLTRKQRQQRYRWREYWRQAPLFFRLLIVVALIIFALRAAATVRLGSYDVTDDGSSYLAFPGILVAYHHFAPGPFSDRHILSSVGGGYWLQVFVLSATSLSNIGMADRTLGLVLLFAAVWDLCIAFGLTFNQIAVIELLVALIPQPTANLTFVILPITLLLSLLWFAFRSIAEECAFPWRHTFLAGAVGGATIALKSTFLPCVGFFCFLPYVILRWRRKGEAFGLPILAGAGAVLVLAAWMLAMKHTAGTFLFPVFGHGLDHTGSGVFGSFRIEKTPRTIVKLFLQGIALLALGFAGFSISRKGDRAFFCLSVMIAAAAGITAFNLAAGGDSIWRYGFPQFLAAILVSSIGLAAVSAKASIPWKKYLALCLTIFPLIGCWFYFDVAGARPRPFRQMTWEFAHYLPSLRASLDGRPLSNPALLSEYRALQDAIPGKAIDLENVAYPFLLNYKDRRIYLMDWPGAAGPAPGWPFGEGSSAVTQYLRQNSVRYLIYDYQYARWADARSCQVIENPQRYSSELYVLFWMSLLAHHQMDAVRTRYASIYDDGRIAAIDLTRPIENHPADGEPWTANTDKATMCSVVMARYSAGSAVAGLR